MLAAPIVPAVLFGAVIVAETNLPDIGTIIPTAAGTGLLLVFLRILLLERRQRGEEFVEDRKRWETERAVLIAEHKDAAAKMRVTHDEDVARLRKRVTDLSAELDEVYARLEMQRRRPESGGQG